MGKPPRAPTHTGGLLSDRLPQHEERQVSRRPPAKRRERTSTARRRKATGSEGLWLIGLVGLVVLSLVVAVMWLVL